jgi:hypothetical protein
MEKEEVVMMRESMRVQAGEVISDIYQINYMEGYHLTDLENYKGSLTECPYEVLEYCEDDILERLAKYKDNRYGYNKSDIVCLNHLTIGGPKIEFIWFGFNGNIAMLSNIKKLIASFGNDIESIENELDETVDLDPSTRPFVDYKGAKELLERLILGLDSFIMGDNSAVEKLLTYTLDCIKRIKEKGDKWEP